MTVAIVLFIFELVTIVAAVGLLYQLPGWWPTVVATFLILHGMLNASIWTIVLTAIKNEKKEIKGGTNNVGIR